MPPKDAEKIKEATLYLDGKPIGKVEELTLPEITFKKPTIKERFIEIIADLITTVCTGITNFLLRIRKER